MAPRFHPELALSHDVAAALASSRPVVALESTLITHGLPYPANVETALAMEAAVRESGAQPATIAILQGRITVGISPDDIESLAARPAGSVRKCSRRDLPIVTGLGDDGATTVAGTMIVAHMAGIRVFATGGIGGVHRGHPFDVSADLMELGRTPVASLFGGEVDPRPAADAGGARDAGRTCHRPRHGHAAGVLHAEQRPADRRVRADA